MKHSRFFSLLLALVLVANFSWVPTGNPNNYGISTCEENPCDFILGSD